MGLCRSCSLGLFSGLAVTAFAIWYQSHYGTPSSCQMAGVELAGKVVVITGANTGIGYHLALQAAQRKARVVMGCRNAERGRIAREQIARISGSQSVAVIGIDLSSIKHVHKFVDKVRELYGRVDVLINNAAVGLPHLHQDRRETSEGLELLMATNHLGPMELSRLMVDLLSPGGRIITLSCQHNVNAGSLDTTDLNSEKEYTYSPSQLYARTKLLNILMTRRLADLVRKEKPDAAVYSVDPGHVWTNIHSGQVDRLTNWLLWLAGPLYGATSPSNACLTPLWLAVAGAETGSHWSDCRPSDRVHPVAANSAVAEAAWVASQKLIHRALQN